MKRTYRKIRLTHRNAVVVQAVVAVVDCVRAAADMVWVYLMVLVDLMQMNLYLMALVVVFAAGVAVAAVAAIGLIPILY